MSKTPEGGILFRKKQNARKSRGGQKSKRKGARKAEKRRRTEIRVQQKTRQKENRRSYRKVLDSARKKGRFWWFSVVIGVGQKKSKRTGSFATSRKPGENQGKEDAVVEPRQRDDENSRPRTSGAKVLCFQAKKKRLKKALQGKQRTAGNKEQAWRGGIFRAIYKKQKEKKAPKKKPAKDEVPTGGAHHNFLRFLTKNATKRKFSWVKRVWWNEKEKTHRYKRGKKKG